MSVRFVPLNAEPGLKAIALQRAVLLIGRHPECDVRIDRPEISRRHCCIAQSDEKTLIRDLGSRNGLRINGRLVSEAELHIGDEVAIAHLIFRFECDPPPSKSPAERSASPPSPPPPSKPESDEILLVPDDERPLHGSR